MQKTKIEWTDYTWNPIKGYCPNTCSYCYAHRMYNRFGWDKNLRYDTIEMNRIHKIKKPSRIFVGSTIDMYHSVINQGWIRTIIEMSKLHPEHTFITLTKYPENLYKYSFPKNWWVGISIDGVEGRVNKMNMLDNLRMDNDIRGIQFISFEPLLKPIYDLEDLDGIDWIIIGGLTPGLIHKKEWIDDIIRKADKLNIPIFIKKNAHYPIERKEFPK